MKRRLFDKRSMPGRPGARRVAVAYHRPMSDGERCDWCDDEVAWDDGFRLYEAAGERRAVFCRLEHIVPWAIRGAHWSAGAVDEPGGLADAVTHCARCEAELPDTSLLLVRHRDAYRIPDGFCSVDHLREWAAAGGRWA